jgi:SNF2 family DNA or RNA helicase
LYNRVTEAVYAYADQHGIGSGFLTVMPQRQVASCMVAAYERFSEATDDDEALNPDFTWDRRTRSAGPLITFLRDELAGKFDEQALQACDSKYEKLREAIRHHWDNHPNSKIVLFAYFKPTLYYLSQRLRADGISTLLLTGDETRDKQEIVDEFSRPESAPVLLSSEVGRGKRRRTI